MRQDRNPHASWAAALAVLTLWAQAPAALAAEGTGTRGTPGREAFSCDFTKALGQEWRMIGGKWELKDGCLRMADARSDDPTKALILIGEKHDVSSEIEIAAKLRLDAWAGDDWARAGVGVCADPVTAHGLNLVFHQGKLQFVHDYVAWGPGCAFPFKVGEWYWVKLYKAAALMKGKAWRDGHPEPADWMVSWNKPDGRATGYPALVGCSASPDKRLSSVSFAQCRVKIADGPFGYYTKRATWHETLAASRETLARQEAELAGKMAEVPGSGKVRRDGLWESLQRDFPDGDSQRQMAAERGDRIWTEDWPFDKPAVLAERYANATRAGLTARARELAKSVKMLPDIEPLRLLYHRARELERSLAQWGPKIESLRLAVEDLSRTYGARYPKGPEYLRRLLELRDALAAAHKAERLLEAAEQFESLRREALLANPLVDFERLLLVKRKDARSFRPLPAFRVQGIGSGPENHINGLPVNFQGNGVLRQVPIVNEIAVLSLARPGGELVTLFRPEKPCYVGDLKLHFDGDRLLFSSIGSHERFQIFELNLPQVLKPAGGSPVRQVTRGEEEDVDNYDSCYLPGGRILFGSSAPFQSVPCQRRWDEVANLFVMNSDGSGARRLCFDQDHDFYPTMMSDGRVLYTRWEYTDIAHAFSARLFTMNPDGTAQRAYYASSSYWPNRIFYAKPIPDQPTKFVGIVTGHHGVARAGELVLFDVSKGRRQADGAIQRIPGWGKGVEAVLRDTLVDASWPKFLHPHPLSDRYFLVACQPTGQSWWGIYLVDVFDNMLLLREEAGWMLLEPVPLRKTPRPPVIPDRVDPESREATVYLADIYAGEGLRGIPRGTVKKLRLYTYHFNYFGTSGIEDYLGMDGPWDVRRVLGTVPVAEDGSAYFVVPANTPLAVQPLDAEGKALQLMRSWFTAMPGEAVSCIGCHEETNSSPPVQRPRALGGEPARITPWHGPVRGFSWDREVQPVLDKYCVGCHNGQQRPDGKRPPDLRRAQPRRFPLSDAPFPPSFYALRRFVRSPGLEGDPRVVPPADYHADTNPLVRMLRQGHQGVQLDEEAWDRLVTWLDMNAPAYGTWLEVPTVRGNRAVQRCRERRSELLRRYAGLDDDPEADAALPPARLQHPAPPPVSEIANRESQIANVSGWPFDAAEAKRRQGAATEMEVELATGVRMRLVRVPAGEFVMGDQAGYGNERPLCKVKIERPFWMGKTEVTNEQFRCFDPSHQSGLEPMLWLKWSWEDYADLGQPRQPVCRVSWNEAAAFCRWLSQKTGKRFSLPSEAQWEWACRAGSDAALSFGPVGADSAPFANLADAALLGFSKWARTQVGFSRTERVKQFYMVDNVDDRQRVTAPVGSYQANAWGLHDMHGNVAEWTRSGYRPYPYAEGGASDHASRVTRHVVRGGSWFDRADLARSACRASYWPWQRVFDVGFRVACEADK